jgi:hypothetical protein
MTGVVSCPACSARYKVRRSIPRSGARMTCPACAYEFRFGPADLAAPSDDPRAERTLNDHHILDIETSLSLTGLQMADEETQINQGPVDEAPLIEERAPAAETQRTPGPQPTPPAIRARRLLAEESYVGADRYIPVVDARAPMRWGLVGAAATLALLGCVAIGGYLAWEPAPPQARPPLPADTSPAAAPPPPVASPPQVAASPAPTPEPPPAAPAPAPTPAPPAEQPAAAPKRPTPAARPPAPTATPAVKPAAAPAAPAVEPAARPAPSPSDGNDLEDPWG